MVLHRCWWMLNDQNTRMRVCCLDCQEGGLCCYLVIHIVNLLHPLQLFYFYLWSIYWLSLVKWVTTNYCCMFLQLMRHNNRLISATTEKPRQLFQCCYTTNETKLCDYRHSQYYMVLHQAKGHKISLCTSAKRVEFARGWEIRFWTQFGMTGTRIRERMVGLTLPCRDYLEVQYQNMFLTDVSFVTLSSAFPYVLYCHQLITFSENSVPKLQRIKASLWNRNALCRIELNSGG
jgi:hypothetical protein